MTISREELITELNNVCAIANGSTDREVLAAQVVLHTLAASLLVGQTMSLADNAAAFSATMVVAMGGSTRPNR